MEDELLKRKLRRLSVGLSILVSTVITLLFHLILK